MDTPTKPTRMMVMLDAILDTRLATLYQIAPLSVDAILPSYRERRSDEFHLDSPLVAEDAYRTAYAKRDVTTLQHARPTPIMFKLTEIIETLESQMAVGHPTVAAIELEVNTYPYLLQPDEQEEIRAIIAASSGMYTTVSTVYVPFDKLTVDYIRQADYGAIFMYDLDQWLLESLQGLTAPPVGVPNCLMIAPALFANREVLRDPSIFRLPNGTMLDPFDSVTHKLADFIGMRFLDALAFSVVNLSE